VAEPWERLIGESKQSFEAFCVYRDLGAERTLRETAEKVKKSSTLIERWSAKHHFVARAEAWDLEKDRLWRATQVASRREVGRRQLQIANAIQGKIIGALQSLDPSKMNARDLAYVLDVTVRVQRLALGQGEKIEVTGADGGPLQFEELSPEQARERLADVAAEVTRRLESSKAPS
jgi:hypothetical protein